MINHPTSNRSALLPRRSRPLSPWNPDDCLTLGHETMGSRCVIDGVRTMLISVKALWFRVTDTALHPPALRAFWLRGWLMGVYWQQHGLVSVQTQIISDNGACTRLACSHIHACKCRLSLRTPICSLVGIPGPSKEAMVGCYGIHDSKQQNTRTTTGRMQRRYSVLIRKAQLVLQVKWWQAIRYHHVNHHLEEIITAHIHAEAMHTETKPSQIKGR